ncbi:DUF4411 family protein [Campylobacter volucris]|nr:DUF4411 family protein [Campylobacter volucris]AJC93681.1 hypothetical protein (DUF4411 domain) [Campylobacter volucris LMG 24379]QEL07894.1 DUF4411 domain-containing protein [Campylobacter volucris]
MDKYLFDSSSLINLVRYYIPFDNNSKLKEFILDEFMKNNFLLLNEVRIECKRKSSGLVFKEIPELDKIEFIKQKDFIIDAKWHNLIDNNFVIKGMKQKLNQDEYEAQKKQFIKSADFALIYYVFYNKNITIITEETINSNDNKFFKKIPAICKFQNINCINLPQFLQEQIQIHYEILNCF